MDATSFAALVASLSAAAVAVWSAMRKERRLDAEESVAVERAEAEIARDADDADDGRWKNYARARERQHNADIARLERRIAEQDGRIEEIASKERDCQIRAAEQSVEITHLRADLADAKADRDELRRELDVMRSNLRRAGIDPGTETHKPL